MFVRVEREDGFLSQGWFLTQTSQRPAVALFGLGSRWRTLRALVPQLPSETWRETSWTVPWSRFEAWWKHETRVQS
ncbi:hypothetical protein C1I92_13230 [Jiangella anatolica]|uniref:Uncharacterized protein n=1 Tax=Jiangella anatolica TaxID=2670374 RepID=A0A2W2BS07_9ACTN|nr:hypothetical protein C1I92_13230 [Jiangella anatolica]